MKKHGTKMLSALLIVVLMLSMSTAVLAAGPNYEQQNTKQDKGAALTLLFAMYAPESLSEYLSTQQEHEQFHAGRKDAHDELKQDAGVQFTDIIDAYKNGEMSAEDAINAIIERKDNLEDFKEELSKIVDAKKAENDTLKTQRESLRLELSYAVKAETPDSALIKSLLEQTLNLLKQHLALDYKYCAQEDAAILQYQ